MTVATGAGAVMNTAKVRDGASLAVFGTGGIGLNAVQGGRLCGAYPLIAVDVADNKLEFLDHLVERGKLDAIEAFMQSGRTNWLTADERERAPGVAARAQVSYDCWVERMEDDWQSAASGPCRQQFQQALAQLNRPVAAAQPATPPPATAQEYRVYFNFDQAGLVPDAQQLLDQVSAQAKRDPNLHVVLVGKADRTGTDQYNMTLSQRRADAVRNALVASGIPADRIAMRWVGEREPPIPTPKGVREPRNRVVEILSLIHL